MTKPRHPKVFFVCTSDRTNIFHVFTAKHRKHAIELSTQHLGVNPDASPLYELWSKTEALRTKNPSTGKHLFKKYVIKNSLGKHE